MASRVPRRLIRAWPAALLGAALAALPACDRLAGNDPDPLTLDTARALPIAVDTVRDQVLAELEQYYADLSSRDWERFADHFWPGATLTTVWQPPGDTLPRVTATTVPEFVAQAPLGPGSREIFEERMISAHVLGGPELVQVWARYAARFGDPGDIREWTGADAITLMKHDGRWRIVSIAYAADPEVR